MPFNLDPARVAAYDLDSVNKSFRMFYTKERTLTAGVRVLSVDDQVDLLNVIERDMPDFDAAILDCAANASETLSKAVGGSFGDLFSSLRDILDVEPVVVSLITKETESCLSLYKMLEDVGDNATWLVLLNDGIRNAGEERTHGTGFPYFDGSKKDAYENLPEKVAAVCGMPGASVRQMLDAGVMGRVPPLDLTTSDFIKLNAINWEDAATPKFWMDLGPGHAAHRARITKFIPGAVAAGKDLLEKVLKRVDETTGRKKVMFFFYSDKGGQGKSFTSRLFLELLRERL
jgi:hypothetical protein